MPSSRGLPRCSFGGIEFPVATISVKGGLRDHVHEFPHTPGGEPEKLGRRLYEITVSALFHDVMLEYGPTLWPKRLTDLRALFEREVTKDLVIPTIGTIQAYAFDWEQNWEAKVQSGEKCTFRFREDSPDTFLVLQEVASAAGVSAAGAKFTQIAQAKKYFSTTPANDAGFFESLTDTVNALTSVADQVELYGNLVEAKARGLATLCNQLDAAVNALRHPVNHELLDAFNDLWVAAIRLQQDAVRAALPIAPYLVPSLMSVGDISRAVFGDGSHAVEIMKMNALDDPLAVPAGTVVQVFSLAA